MAKNKRTHEQPLWSPTPRDDPLGTTIVVGKAPRFLKATYVNDIGKARDTTPGAYDWFVYHRAGDHFAKREPAFAGLDFVCPCGCRRLGMVWFHPTVSPSHEWDRNVERPTLTGEIQFVILGVTHWRGVLRKGVWERQ